MGDVYTFGPFILDIRAARLTRDGRRVALSAVLFALLRALVERAGDVVTKEELIAAGWGQQAIEDNTLAKMMLRLRRALNPSNPTAYVETAARQGYRLTADVTRVSVRAADSDPDARLAPYRAFLDGRALLETLDRDKIRLACQLFTEAVRRDPTCAANHVGLANAHLLQHEATRMDDAPDVDALGRAEAHVREARRLNDTHAEASATLGLVLFRRGFAGDAAAALRLAVALEPGNWRHHARLAWVSWVRTDWPACAMPGPSCRTRCSNCWQRR